MRTVHLFIALIVGQPAFAQWFNNGLALTTQNGLSNNTITSIRKDSAGFLWIGTHEGLNRYDGTEFINVLSNTKNNLPSNNITKILFINKNLLAVGTDAGLCLLNTTTFAGRSISLPFNPTFVNSGYYISDLLYKKETGELWVCTWHGLFVLTADGKLIKKLMAPATDMPKGFFAKYLFSDAASNIYFFSQQKQHFYYPDFTRQATIPVEEKTTGFVLNDFMNKNYSLMNAQMVDNEMTCIFSKAVPEGRDERIYYSNNTTGRYFSDRLHADVAREQRISNAFPLNDSIFLLNSFFGEPMLYNSVRHTTSMAADQPLWFTSWPDGVGATIYRDGNNIWAGTSKSLLQFPMKTDFFKTNPILTNHLKDKSSLVSYNYAIYKNNTLWVACMGAGLFGIDTAKNTVVSLADQFITPAFRRKIISTQVLDAGKSLWLFSVYGPVEINGASSMLRPVEGTNKDSSFDNAASFPIKDSRGNTWVSLPDGISEYNAATGSFTNYKTRYRGGVFPLMKAGVKTEDNNGNLWMAREDTLLKLNTTTKTFSTSLLVKEKKSIRPVTSMASDGNDLLYLAVARSFGIYSITTGTIDLFTKQTGIISTAINEIVSDKAGNAWIATEGGLVFYNKQKKKFSSFTKADGLPDDNVININFTDDTKTTLFLGFAKTYCLFEPQHFLLEDQLPGNIITGFEADGTALDIHGNHQLTYRQNNIFFTYTGINYNQGQQNNYACMLEGFDQDWKYTGTERKVNYINLPPGTYTFKMKTANHQGEWNEIPATLSFEITPPFWQRWWFRCLAILAVVGGAWYLIKKREADFQKENTIKLQLSELRMQALRAQMNPHFIFNSLNSIQNYILSNNTIDAAGYLSKFAKLMRRILDQSKHNFLPLAEVMETLRLYVEIEAFRFNHEFSYVFDIEQNDELMDTDMPPMLLQPFAENAILHGLMPKKGDKKLIITARLINNRVEITIDDNGIGRTNQSAKAGHESQGGKITAGMLESLQQIKNTRAFIDITDKIENDKPAGTTVKLVLPLNK